MPGNLELKVKLHPKELHTGDTSANKHNVFWNTKTQQGALGMEFQPSLQISWRFGGLLEFHTPNI